MIQCLGKLGFLLACICFLSGCLITTKPSKPPTLNAPTNSKPLALIAVREGNLLFASGKWKAAINQYQIAIQAQPKMAEAHYNLALTLDRLGNREKARDHYMKAANLAPGHLVIWNSPVLRRYGDVRIKQKGAATSQPLRPSMGGGSMGNRAFGGANLPPGGN